MQGNKTFDVTHPLDSTKRLRHFALESPKPRLQYNFTIDFTSTTQSFDLPEYFKHINADPVVFMNPFEHFGSGWGRVVDNVCTCHVSTKGLWHIVIYTIRQDAWVDGVNLEAEYVPSPPAPMP